MTGIVSQIDHAETLELALLLKPDQAGDFPFGLPCIREERNVERIASRVFGG